ncbi:MAG: cell division protein FtsL [Gammaproteobacteria bacterium]|nr:cell division protein FtsL [Gammaproteobacteria bacterium]
MTGRFFVLAVIVVFLISTAVGVVYARHESRKLFVELQKLERERDDLNIEWGRLQLEQGAWSSHGRIEGIAREKLEMRMPDASTMVIWVP